MMRRILAITFTILIVFPLVLTAQFSVSAVTFALDREFYIEALGSDLVYESVMERGLLNRIANQQLNLPLSTKSPEMEELFQSIITQEYFREQMRTLVNNFFDYLQGASESFDASLDITPVKSAFSGGEQAELTAALLAAVPVCEPGQTPGFGVEGQASCKPAGTPDDLIVQLITASLPAIVNNLPDEIALVENWEQEINHIGWPSFLPGMALPAISLLSVIFLCFVAGLFWYLCSLIADDSWRVRLQWLGWTLIIPSIMVFLIGIAADSTLPNFWVKHGLEQVNFQLFSIGFITPQILRVLIQSALPRISNAFIMVGGICGALGFGLIFWGLATSRSKPRKIDPSV